jgi:hypothetical protein
MTNETDLELADLVERLRACEPERVKGSQYGGMIYAEAASAILSLSERIAVLEGEEVDWSQAERGKFFRPTEDVLARIGEAAEGAVLSEMSWPEVGEAVLEALRASLTPQEPK